jgi:hypothetical protein
MIPFGFWNSTTQLSIIQNNLIMYLDSSISASYPASGTVWTDLSPVGNNGTLVNGVAYNSSFNGILNFDGINDYVSIPNNFINWTSGQSFTISVWFRTTTSGIILGQQNGPNPTQTDAYVPAIYVGTDGKIHISAFWGGATDNKSISTVSVTDNNWKNITVVFVNGEQRSYLNGQIYSSLAKGQVSYTSTYYYFIGSGRYDGWSDSNFNPYFNGDIPVIMVYDTALSNAEVLSNYNALKTRFGL